MKNHLVFLISITLLFPFFASAQSNTQVSNHLVKDWNVETGYFSNGQPYAKAGNGDKILILIEALSFENTPPEGFLLKLFVNQSKSFYEDYTVYRIGRRPNLSKGYSIDQMSKDYGSLISKEFNSKVDVIGESTGGQIGLCLAANYPELINKIVIISAAYKVSEQGKVIERKAAEYFAQEKYGKTMATVVKIVYDKGFKRFFYMTIMNMVGPSMLKDIQYPNDFQVGVEADCNMDFKDRLGEIKVPTLLIVGENDIGYSLEDVKETSTGIRNSELIIYENFGHNLYSDNYEEVNKNIYQFLNL